MASPLILLVPLNSRADTASSLTGTKGQGPNPTTKKTSKGSNGAKDGKKGEKKPSKKSKKSEDGPLPSIEPGVEAGSKRTKGSRTTSGSSSASASALATKKKQRK